MKDTSNIYSMSACPWQCWPFKALTKQLPQSLFCHYCILHSLYLSFLVMTSRWGGGRRWGVESYSLISSLIRYGSYFWPCCLMSMMLGNKYTECLAQGTLWDRKEFYRMHSCLAKHVPKLDSNQEWGWSQKKERGLDATHSSTLAGVHSNHSSWKFVHCSHCISLIL